MRKHAGVRQRIVATKSGHKEGRKSPTKKGCIGTQGHSKGKGVRQAKAATRKGGLGRSATRKTGASTHRGGKGRGKQRRPGQGLKNGGGWCWLKNGGDGTPGLIFWLSSWRDVPVPVPFVSYLPVATLESHAVQARVCRFDS